MIVVFDTNIWKSNLFLQSPAAAAARYYLKKTGARVGMPEVIRREVTVHLTKEIADLVSSVRDDHQKLLRLFGKMKEVVLPTVQEQSETVRLLFETLGVEIIDVPFSLESASDSFNRTIEKLPPSTTSQQFKDGVIWADCLGLAQLDEVILVAHDNAFYKAGSDEMHPILREEAKNAPYKLRLMKDIKTLLADIRVRVEINKDELEIAIFDQKPVSSPYLAEHGFDAGPRTLCDWKLYATESPSKLFLNFKFEYSCPDNRGTGRPPGVLSISGNCFYEPTSGLFSQMQREGDAFQFVDETGVETELKTISARAHLYLGHRTVMNETRYPLDGSDAI
jgi:hypothetical protein